jgi:hypothetical protein
LNRKSSKLLSWLPNGSVADWLCGATEKERADVGLLGLQLMGPLAAPALGDLERLASAAPGSQIWYRIASVLPMMGEEGEKTIIDLAKKKHIAAELRVLLLVRLTPPGADPQDMAASAAAVRKYLRHEDGEVRAVAAAALGVLVRGKETVLP